MARTFTFETKGLAGTSKGGMFDSLTDMADWFQAKRAAGQFRPSGWGSSEQARARLLTGDAAMVARSDKMLSLIEAASPNAIAQTETIRTVTGGLADVPAFLAGSPMNMRLRRKRETLAPLTIVVNVASSAAVNNDMLEQRGAATLALLRKLEGAGHPVELWIMHACARDYRADPGSHGFVKMETRPLDLARTAWALGSAEFSRECIYSAVCTVANDADLSPWPWGEREWSSKPDLQKATTAQAMGIDPATLLYLPMLYSPAMGSPFANDKAAVTWVNETYAEAVAKAQYLL